MIGGGWEHLHEPLSTKMSSTTTQAKARLEFWKLPMHTPNSELRANCASNDEIRRMDCGAWGLSVCMNRHVPVYTVYTHTYTYTYTHTHTHTHTHTCMHACMHTYIHTCKHMLVYVYIYVYTHADLYITIYTYSLLKACVTLGSQVH